MTHLNIDLEKCIGCGKCARMCMKDHIEIVDKKAREKDNGCLECSHCVSSCPKGAIELIPSEPNGNVFKELKKDKVFDGRPVSDEDLQELFRAMNKTIDAYKCEMFVLQGPVLDSFIETVWDIVNEKEADMPVVKEWRQYRMGHNMERPSPVLWESRQLMFIFANSPDDAATASVRMVAKGLNLGIRGYHSNIVMAAYKACPERILEYFPDATKKLYMAYVIGHPRRLIEPVMKPMEKLKGIFGKR